MLDSDGSFAILASTEDGSRYAQFMEADGGVLVEIADPTYNDEAPLTDEQLAAVADLGFDKRDVNFGRDFAPGVHDADSLAALLVECFEKAFGITDMTTVEVSVDA